MQGNGGGEGRVSKVEWMECCETARRFEVVFGGKRQAGGRYARFEESLLPVQTQDPP